jgi:hypothetical protein
MSARAFKVELTNGSGHPLTKSFDHLCGGDWTPSLRPPDSIADAQQVAWRSESSGVGTGTEGYVKYSIEGVGDTVYIYWDNPFLFGETHAKGGVSTTDVEPDCDFAKSAGSSFPAPSNFEIFQSAPVSEGTGGPAGSAFGLVGEIGLAPIVVFGSLGIQEDALISLTLSAKARNVRSFALRRRFDPSKGIRSLVLATGGKSLKSTMGL